MTIKRVALWGTGLILGLLFIAVTYLLQYLDQHLEGLAHSVLEREVRIEKGVSLDWSLPPAIELRGVWIGNPEWAKGEYLLRAERVTARLSLDGLLQRRLELKEVTVQNADIALEQAADGRQNWSFGEASGTAPGAIIGALKVEDSRLGYRSPDDAEYSLDIPAITLNQRDGGQRTVDARFSYQRALIEVSALEGDPNAAPSAGWKLNGRVETPDLPPIEMTAQTEVSDCCLRLTQLQATSDNSDISGELSFPLAEGGRIEAALQSDLLDLRPFSKHSEKPAGDTQSLLERKLPTDVLQGFEGALQIKVGRMHIDSLALQQVDIGADLQKDRLKLQLGAYNKRVTANIDVKPTASGWQYTLNQTGKLKLSELLDPTQPGGDSTQAPLDIDLHLRGSGTSLDEFFRSARGQFLMVVGEGKLSKGISNSLPLGSVIYTLLNAVLPDEQKGKHSKLECAVVQFDIANGIATSSKGLALRTDQLNVLGGGAINLQTGEIQFKFKTAPRRGLGISFVGVADRLFDVTGTLQHPTATLSMERAATFGAMAWATSGLSILANSVFSRLSAATNPCETVLKGAK
ncbi:MAG: AsmA family protein [Oceanospirillaceae bacterium]|nr:AsmA family protein [Oceanospirillaceae bacterium]